MKQKNFYAAFNIIYSYLKEPLGIYQKEQFYISSEGLGILENITVIGVSVPQKLKSILEQMKDDSSEENKK